MKYIVCLAALLSVAFATSDGFDVVRRQQPNVQQGVPVNVAAMTDANGNVLQFDSKNVYLDGQAKGL